MKGNIMIDRLPLGRDTDRETEISLSSGNIISTGSYHDPWPVCISGWYGKGHVLICLSYTSDKLF